MRIRMPRSVNRLLGLGVSFAMHHYSAALDARYWSATPEMDPKCDWTQRPLVYAFWHEYLFLPVSFFGRCNVSTMTSQHRDGDLIAELADFMGFKIFRGSTTHGGTQALRQMIHIAQQGYHLTLMPDGPRGPRREFSLGTIFLASKLGVPLVPVGIAYDRPWRFHSWDRFAIPRPGSRVRLIFPEAITIPQHLKRSELEAYRLLMDEKMRQVNQEAEAWAASGAQRPGEKVLDHRPMRLKKYLVENLR